MDKISSQNEIDFIVIVSFVTFVSLVSFVFLVLFWCMNIIYLWLTDDTYFDDYVLKIHSHILNKVIWINQIEYH